MTDLNWVDYFILFVFLFSTLAGLLRGFVKEVLAILTWVAGLIIASLFATKLATVFTSSDAGQSVISGSSSVIGSDMTHSVSLVSIGLSFVCLFLVTLIIGAMISRLITTAVNGASIGFANRLFGGVFGLARGFLINLVIIFVVQLTAFEQDPLWKESRLVPYFQSAVVWLGNIVYPGLESIKTTISHVGTTLTSKFSHDFNQLNFG